MEIIISPKDFSERLMHERLDEIDSVEFDDIKVDLKEIDENYSLKEVNFGRGADFVLLLVGIATIINVITLGDKIEKGLDGWVKIGKRIKSLFKNSNSIYLDKDASKILAIEYLVAKFNANSIELIGEIVIPLENNSSWFKDRTEKDFISSPHNVCLFTFIINNSLKILLSVRSDGEIRELVNYETEFQWPF